MTLRKYLERIRTKRYLIAAAIAMPAWIVAFISPKGGTVQLVAGAVFLVAAFAGTLSVGRIACPRCANPLGMVAQHRFRFGERFMHLDKCSKCGLGLEEEVPGTPKY